MKEQILIIEKLEILKVYDEEKEVYYFKYYDGSVLEISKSKIIIISKAINLKKIEAILSLENKLR